MFNKNTSRKINDRKVLHKVHKNWVVVSFALLMAIGGSTLVGQATHANADSTNASASSKTELNIDPEIQSEANSLEAPVQMQSAQSSAPSATSANGNSSANSSVTYLQGDNGSAASYNQKALNDKASYMPAEQTVNSYVTSLNNRFSPEVNSLKGNINSYATQQSNDASLAGSYSATAAKTNTASVLASLASSAGMTPNDYANSVKDTKSGFAENIKQGKSLSSEMATVNSYAQLINNIDNNTATSEAYMLSAVSADDAFTIAKARVDNDKNALNAMNSSDQDALKSGVSYNKLALADRIALINSGIDASYTSSLATKLGFNNSNNALNTTSRNIFSAASNFNASNHSASINFQNASGSAVPLNTNDSGLYQVLSDTDAMIQFSHAKSASATFSTGNLASANNALNSDNSAEATASKAAKIADILGNHPTLANLFGTVSTYTVHNQSNASAENAMNKTEATVAAQVKSTEATEKSANNAVASTQASLSKVAKPTSAQKSALTVAQSSAAKVDQSADAAIGKLYSSADKQMNSDIANNATDSIASSVAGNLLDRASYAEVSDMVRGLNASGINSAASLLNNSLSSENASSASYDNDTDANVILAPYYAQSYSADASADAKNVATAKNTLNDFYSSHSDQNFTKALDMAKNSQKNFVQDSVLAYAFGVHVFNHSPKYVSMKQGTRLYSSVNFGDNTKIRHVYKGAEVRVYGVGFGANGTLRYAVRYHGIKGYITADPNVVQASYLPANRKVTVTTTRHVYAYKNNSYRHAVHYYKRGTKLAGTVVSEDNMFGGYTRIRLMNGLYITSNVSTVHLDTINVPAQPTAKQANNNQKINVVSFD